MSTQSAYLIATLTTSPSSEELEALSSRVSALEVRADLIGDLDPETLRRHFGGDLIYTLRSSSESGRGQERGDHRATRIAKASRGFDFVDLEIERDQVEELIRAIPAERRILSWHGRAAELDELRQRLEAMESVGGRYYKLVTEAQRTGDGLLPLAFARGAARDDLIAFASGAAGGWTRLLAPRLGAPVIYGSAGAEPAAPGQLSIERLRRDYGLPQLPQVRDLYGIAGNPVRHSLSPRLYNRMFRERGVAAAYLPFCVQAFGDFWLDVVESGSLEVLGFSLKGLSVTSPFKEIALAVSGATSPLAEHVGSANTLTLRRGVWEAESTDPEGVLGPLRTRNVDLADRRAVVVGAGGAGRAAVFALAHGRARVTLVNRSAERGRRVAAELDVEFAPYDDFDPSEFDVLVNATPLGRGDDDALPFDPARLAPTAAVVDLAYVPGAPTRLVRAVERVGAQAIDGREVLFAQAIPQARTMTGLELLPEQVRDLQEPENDS